MGLQGETSKLGNSIFAFSLASAGGLFAIIVYTILVPIMIFFMLFDKEAINGWISKFFPKKLELTQKAYFELNLKIGNYIRCKFIEIIIVWVSSFILFLALGLNYSLLLSFLCGISVIIPYVGMIAVTIPIILVSYFQWGIDTDFWYVVVGHLLIQAIDGNVVVPILFSDAVNIHPFAILLSILFFGSIWGIWGVFFAIPLAVLINTILNVWPHVSAPGKSMNIFKGSMVAIVTPMKEDGSLDFVSLNNLIEFHIENKTDVIVSVGTTGESATLDFEEHSQVIKKL